MAQTFQPEAEEKIVQLPKRIMKSSGTSEPFDMKKLEFAITQSLGNCDDSEQLKKVLLDTVLKRIDGKTTTSTHFINDIIEVYLLRNKHYDVLQKYIDNRLEKNKVYSEKVNLLGSALVTDPSYNKKELDDFSVNQIQIAANRYLQRDMNSGDIVESMTDWFHRVASHVVLGSVVYDPVVYAKEGGQWIHEEDFSKYVWEGHSLQQQIPVLERLYKKLNQELKMRLEIPNFMDFISDAFRTGKYQKLYQTYFKYMYEGIFEPNTPTLMNSGTANGKLSACFTLGVQDNLDHIATIWHDAAMIFKGAGGVGINVSYIRPEGSNIDGTYGAATGPISLELEMIDDVTDVVKSGGKRRGANMGLMEYWHPDINKFVDYKLQVIPPTNQELIGIVKLLDIPDEKKKQYIQVLTPPGNLLNFNVSVMFDEDFWKFYDENKSYPLRFGDKVFGFNNPREFINHVAESAWKSAEPGVAFKDNANKANPLRTLKGDINICNPCLTGDTRLATDKGMIRMDELYLSGKQLQIPTDNRTINGNPEEKGITLRSAVPVFKTSDSANVWEVETKHGYSVKATDYHKFFVNRNGNVKMIELKDLKVGDDLLIQSDEGYFGTEGNYDIGLLLGLLESDGHISNNKPKPVVVLQFNGEDKKSIVDKTLKIVNNILPKTKSSNNIQDVKGSEISSRNLKLIQTSRLYEPIVEQLGYVKGQVPEIVWKGTRDCVIGYLQGLFGMDGTVNISCHKSYLSIRLNQSDKPFLQQVQQLLGNFGIMGKIYLRRKACGQFFPDGKGGKRIYARKDNYDIIIGGKHVKTFMDEIGFCLENKNKKALDFINNSKHEFYNNKNDFQNPIKSITYIGKQPVYDTTEYQTHTITVNNIVTSQCAEQFMYDGESCTLGSINLAKLIRIDGTFDWDRYVEVIHETTRFLNDVLEINQYPTEHIAEESDKSKRIGLGIMGLADLFFLLKIPYHSQEGFQIMEELSKTLYIESVKTSIDLAEERGSCYWYEQLVKEDKQYGSIVRNYNDRNKITTALGTEYVEKIDQHGIRNMWTTTIAPTGTISMIADCSSGLEPIFSLVFSKITTAGKYYYTSELFKQALIDAGIYSQELLEKVEKNYGSCQGIDEIPKDIQKVFLTAMDLHWIDHVVAQSVWQNWIDNSISKTINMPYNVTVDDVKNAYILAHELGLKGIALFRDGSRNEQVLHVGSNVQSNKNEQNVQKDTVGTQTIVSAPTATKNQVERKVVPSRFGMNYIRDRVNEELMAQLTIHAGKSSTYMEKGDECPSCKKLTLVSEGGCNSCKSCGYASCSVA